MADKTLAQVIHDNWADLVKIPDVAKNHQAYDVIAAYLNARPLIDNPTPRGTVPLPLSLTHVFTVIMQLPHGAAEMAKLQKLPDWAYNGGVAAMQERSASSIENWLTSISLIVGLEAETMTAMNAARVQLLAATEPDPNYQEQIAGESIATAAGLPYVQAADVQAADPGAGAW